MFKILVETFEMFLGGRIFENINFYGKCLRMQSLLFSIKIPMYFQVNPRTPDTFLYSNPNLLHQYPEQHLRF